MDTFKIQHGKGIKGSYKTKWSFTDPKMADFYYASLNIREPNKKRLIMVYTNGRQIVIHRTVAI